MELIKNKNGFNVRFKGRNIIEHSPESPFISAGRGQASFCMKRGRFNTKGEIERKIDLINYKIEEKGDKNIKIAFLSDNKNRYFIINIREEKDRLTIEPGDNNGLFNRIWVKIKGSKREHIYGCGEHHSKFDLKGEMVKIWVEEHTDIKAICRKRLRKVLCLNNKVRKLTKYGTYYAQPTFISSENYFCHVESNSFMNFDFTCENYSELEIWEIPEKIVIGINNNFSELSRNLSRLLGRQTGLPDWVYRGVILGIQGGSKVLREKVNRALSTGVEVSGLWIQDWEGARKTSFGDQLFWNWKWDEELYPGLPQDIRSLKVRDIRILGYINPFLAIEGELYREAAARGYLVKNSDGDDYLVHVTTFPAAIIDLTNPEAYNWIKEIIKTNMLDLGFSGWMADFGEYLPPDGILYGNKLGYDYHNIYPVLWAKVNREAVVESGKEGDILIFNRSGYSGIQRYSSLMWTGDHHVDYSSDWGLPSVVKAFLSSSISGVGIQHTDIGGYTGLLGMKRTKELLLRWMELAAFTPVMRTHEGNRPDKNWQFDSDRETLFHLARMSRVYKKIGPYISKLVKDTAQEGIPVIRPVFYHYRCDKAFELQDEYLLGRDLLVAPVYRQGVDKKEVYLPEDDWVHIWTGNHYSGGMIEIPAPVGYPPVFYRGNSDYRGLFTRVT